MTYGDAPFVLMEDARSAGGRALLFERPDEIIVASDLSEIAPALSRARDALKRGRHVAGFLSYEAGLALEPKLARMPQKPRCGRLLWFGVFDAPRELNAADIVLPDPEGAWLSSPRPRITRGAYDAAFARVQDHLVGGDVYQINLSYRADLTLLGYPLAAYARLRAAGGGGHSGVVFDGEDWLLSTSPELFFRIRAGAIEAKPMKGTAKRGADELADNAAKHALVADPKERAENVMIVDLLRNDLGRVAKTGSVHVPALFDVETYPTIHTLTSTVRAELGEGRDVVDVLRALFPCGSVTGAPKIRAMEIIADLEGDARGAYTGSIGWMAPNGDAEFNVAIRTIAVRDGAASVGLGGGVVVDSTCDAEWRETEIKGAFATARQPEIQLIETMRFEPGAGIYLRDLHMARLAHSAKTFDFAFDQTAIEASLGRELADAQAGERVRLLLSRDGAVTIERAPLPLPAEGPVAATLVKLPVRNDDFRLRHKMTSRGFYDEARAAAGTWDVVFVGADGFITEGSFANVFVQCGNALLTPRAERGLLPGVLRAHLLNEGKAIEADLTPTDLAGGFFFGNALRGLTSARLV